MSDIAYNIAQAEARICAACARAGRPRDAITLIAISKAKPAEDVLAAMAAGVRHFGENRVEEASGKVSLVSAAAGAAPVWHMVGHLQSRKAREAAALFDAVHSVDSLRLAQKLADACRAQSRRLGVFVEVNISGEESKIGLPAHTWEQDRDARTALFTTIEAIARFECFDVQGLMTMAPYTAEPEATRPVFRGLARLTDALREGIGLSLPCLSMGMTNDFEIAIEEGATHVRIGRAIFGER